MLRFLMTLSLLCCACGIGGAAMTRKTEVSIEGERFLINGRPTYAGCVWQGRKLEGLLFNARMVQGIFDDLNPATRGQWAYPDTGKWDAGRNAREFLAAMPEWRKHGLLAITLNLQGGSPQGYSRAQPWRNSAITEEGALRPDYMARLERILNRADALGMVVILGIFYFGQDQRLKDEAAVKRALDNALDWLFARGYRNVLIEVNNECNVRYDHAILQPERVHELIERAKARQQDGRRFLVGTSYGGGTIPQENVARASDFLLLHGNGVAEPERIARMVRQTRQVAGYRPMPILFNEDDHFDFDKPENNLLAALGEYASWGYFDWRMKGEGFDEGYQSVPVNWKISSARKRGFFEKVREITQAAPQGAARPVRASPGKSVTPGKAWATRTPEEVGLSRAKLDALRDLVGGRGCVARRGYMAYAWGDQSRSGEIASAVKPLISALLLLAIQEGRLKSVDDRVADFEPRLKALNGGKDGGITWRQLASQTSGYGLSELPGKAYSYNDFALALYYDTLTQKVFREEGTSVLKSRLADALQFQDAYSFEARGPAQPGRLAVSVRDFARFGLLCLRGGRWKNRQVIQPNLLRLALNSPVPADMPHTQSVEAEMLPGQRTLGGGKDITPVGPGYYSFNWWLNRTDRAGRRLHPGLPPDAYAASGHGGPRMLWIVPSLDLIVSWNDANVSDFDASPGNPESIVNRAARLIAEAVLETPDAEISVK